jgi:hypothetical protein
VCKPWQKKTEYVLRRAGGEARVHRESRREGAKKNKGSFSSINKVVAVT